MLTGKIAIVTGASRGIGRQIAKTLAEQGAAVIVNYCGSEQAANETVEQITASGGTAKAYQAVYTCSLGAENHLVILSLIMIMMLFNHFEVIMCY